MHHKVTFFRQTSLMTNTSLTELGPGSIVFDITCLVSISTQKLMHWNIRDQHSAFENRENICLHTATLGLVCWV